jgi:hypothetical protein
MSAMPSIVSEPHFSPPALFKALITNAGLLMNLAKPYIKTKRRGGLFKGGPCTDHQ